MKKAKRIQKRVANYENFNRIEKASNLSYKFKIEKLKEYGWVKVGTTTDGFATEIFKKPKLDDHVLFISQRCFGLTTSKHDKPSIWFNSEVIFETMLENFEN